MHFDQLTVRLFGRTVEITFADLFLYPDKILAIAFGVFDGGHNQAVQKRLAIGTVVQDIYGDILLARYGLAQPVHVRLVRVLALQKPAIAPNRG